LSAPYSPVVLVTLSAFAAMSWWLFKETAGEKPQPRIESEYTADAFVAQMIVSNINAQGTLEYRLSADRADYFADDRTELRNPSLSFMREEGQPWQVKADRAQITERGKSIELFGSVEIQRNPEPGRSAVHAHTDHLLLRADEQIAETDASVRLEISDSRVTADGMRAFLKQGRVELLSGVTGRYEQQGK
jgi:lipopolysaccharide export system protein LptC